MLMYECDMCGLSEDADLVPEDRRVIGCLLHVIWPFDGVSNNPAYVCKDCYKLILSHITGYRDYLTDMAMDAHMSAQDQPDAA